MNAPMKLLTWQDRIESAIRWLSPVWAYRRALRRQARADDEQRERQRRADKGSHPAGPRREALEAEARRHQPWLQQRAARRREWR